VWYAGWPIGPVPLGFDTQMAAHLLKGRLLPPSRHEAAEDCGGFKVELGTKKRLHIALAGWIACLPHRPPLGISAGTPGCALVPETKGLIDARRLALMKPGALLINVARAAIVDEDALYAALKDGHLGGAALDVWWQYPTPAEPERRPSRRPFHELSNVLITPHSSSSSEATADRRWSTVVGNLDRFARGEPLQNVVFQT
jgi:hypothetical protein